MILIKSDGFPTYNFANVVDDHLMNITHVVRGNEYLSSSPKYNRLYDAFGWEVPTYIHCPLITNEDHQKLSKRSGHSSFEDLLEQGFLTEAIINFVALLGWSPEDNREIFSLQELVEAFDYHNISKSPAVLDMTKLKWMNGEYIKAMAPEEFARRSFPFSGLEGTLLAEKWNRIAPLLQQRVEKLDEIPEKIAFLRALPEYGVDFFCNKKSKSNPEIAKTILNDLLPACEAQQEWSAEALSALFTTYATEHGMKLGLPMWGVRIAVSGCLVTPGGPAEIMEILGKEESLRRIRLALGKL